MSLAQILKKQFFLQEKFSQSLCRVPPVVHHNEGKIKALRKAFAYTGLEAIEGDYLEFGVFQGASLISAIYAYKYQNDDYHLKNEDKRQSKCRFIGCDSFEGLRSDPKVDDKHTHYDNQKFLLSDYDMVMKRVKKFRKDHEIHLVKGYFKDTLKSEQFLKIGVKKLRVVLFDADLKSSTRDALNCCAPYLQQGTILLFDEIFSYKGDPDQGELGALNEFSAQYPEFKYRDFGDYGFNGQLKIVVQPPKIALHS